MLQERLRGGVIITTFVSQVRIRHLINTGMNISHELADRFFHKRLVHDDDNEDDDDDDNDNKNNVKRETISK